MCFKASSVCQINTSFVYIFNTGTSAQKPVACRAYWVYFSRVSTNSPQTWKWLFRQALKWLYFSVHVWRHGGNRFSRTSGIYDGWVKRRERDREGWKESDEWEAVLVITLYLLSLFVCCGRFIQSQVGTRRWRVCVCMHACVLVFASASGNVLLVCVCVSACACVVLLTENSLERASQTCKGCQNPAHTHTHTLQRERSLLIL